MAYQFSSQTYFSSTFHPSWHKSCSIPWITYISSANFCIIKLFDCSLLRTSDTQTNQYLNTNENYARKISLIVNRISPGGNDAQLATNLQARCKRVAVKYSSCKDVFALFISKSGTSCCHLIKRLTRSTNSQ